MDTVQWKVLLKFLEDKLKEEDEACSGRTGFLLCIKPIFTVIIKVPHRCYVTKTFRLSHIMGKQSPPSTKEIMEKEIGIPTKKEVEAEKK